MAEHTTHVYKKHPIMVGGAIVAILGIGAYLFYKSEHPALAASTPVTPSGGTTPAPNVDQNTSTTDVATGSTTDQTNG